MTSMETVEEQFDTFILSIFEACYAHEQVHDNESFERITTEKSNAIIQSYEQVKQSILDLKGVTKSRDELIEEIKQKDDKYAVLRNDILLLEKKLIEKRERIAIEIQKVCFVAIE